MAAHIECITCARCWWWRIAKFVLWLIRQWSHNERGPHSSHPRTAGFGVWAAECGRVMLWCPPRVAANTEEYGASGTRKLDPSSTRSVAAVYLQNNIQCLRTALLYVISHRDPPFALFPSFMLEPWSTIFRIVLLSLIYIPTFWNSC